MADRERGRLPPRPAGAEPRLPSAASRCGGGASPGIPRSRGGGRGVAPAMLMPDRCGDSAALEAPPASDSVRGVAAAEAVAVPGSSKPSGENI